MSSKKYDLVGIGNALLDFQLEVTDAVLDEFQVKKASMTLVEATHQLKLLSILREEKANKSISISSGGSAANTLAGFSNFGGKAAFIGKLGSDENGKTYVQDLEKCGVSFNGRLEKELVTGSCLALITPDAERTMLTSLGAAIELAESDIDPELIKSSNVIYIEGYLWDSPSARRACQVAMKIARENNVKVAMSFSDAFCVDRHRADFMALLKSKSLDYLFCNETEALSAAQTKNVQEAFESLSSLCDHCYISTGPRGALASEGFGKLKENVSTWDVELVDKIGAGDLFASGVLYGITKNKSLRERAYLGCYSATRIIQQMSARLNGVSLAEELAIALKGPASSGSVLMAL
ncbi:MAG: adenosine kinase [Deltaproteobacteria bacterium CG11_big_fil_rev_8_21_14_0_20_45_16]|nr:MAG: adenosine kinase [Deltaproteobacteria bacterium CG11_big_fil_rev_8_21_14_0_20_45_16]